MKWYALILVAILVLPHTQIQSSEQGQEQEVKWESYESEHFVFYYPSGYLTPQELASIAQTQEALFAKITQVLSVEYYKKIKYYLYGDRGQFESIPGAYTVDNEIWFLCVFCTDFCKAGLNDAHEMTHAISNDIAFQYGLLAEGLAVYMEDHLIKEENLHGIIKILYTEDRLTMPEELITDYWSDILFNYEIAGSFATFLIDEYGMDKFKELYRWQVGDYAFREVYGKSLSELQREWLSVVQKAETTQKEEDIVKYRDTIQEGLAVYFELGFGPTEYASYPARAEEGICLFRTAYKEDPEKAFPYLAQFNEGMKAWKEAIETFDKALRERDYQEKVELFRKANGLYATAGDEKMIERSSDCIEGYETLMRAQEYLGEGDISHADKEFGRAKSIFEELGEESEVRQIVEQMQGIRDLNIEAMESLLILVACSVVVLTVKGLRRVK